MSVPNEVFVFEITPEFETDSMLDLVIEVSRYASNHAGIVALIKPASAPVSKRVMDHFRTEWKFTVVEALNITAGLELLLAKYGDGSGGIETRYYYVSDDVVIAYLFPENFYWEFIDLFRLQAAFQSGQTEYYLDEIVNKP